MPVYKIMTAEVGNFIPVEIKAANKKAARESVLSDLKAKDPSKNFIAIAFKGKEKEAPKLGDYVIK